MTARTIQELIHEARPNHRIVSASDPEPPIQPFNVIGVYRSADHARNAVLALEDIENVDGAVGLTVIEPNDAPPADRGDADADIVDDIAPRTIKGAAIGFVVGAIVIGAATALFSPDIWIGGALGGALMGSAFGAVWGAFLKMGGGDAYRQTFVSASDQAVTIVSLHTADERHAEAARARLALESAEPPIIVRVPTSNES